MAVAKLTTRQKFIFGYSGIFCTTALAGGGYLIHQYFFDPQFDEVRDRLHTRETIVQYQLLQHFSTTQTFFCIFVFLILGRKESNEKF